MNFEHRLIETGGSIEIEMADGGQGYGRDAEFRYRWQADKVEVGIGETFDRWANSRDFVLHRPIERVDLDVLRHACHLAMDQGHHDEGWAAEFDIGQLYRKARRSR